MSSINKAKEKFSYGSIIAKRARIAKRVRVRKKENPPFGGDEGQVEHLAGIEPV
jgi:hypothetical protein